MEELRKYGKFEFLISGQKIEIDLNNLIKFVDYNESITLNQINEKLIKTTQYLVYVRNMVDEIFRSFKKIELENEIYFAEHFYEFSKKMRSLDNKMSDTSIKQIFLKEKEVQENQKREMSISNDLEYLRRIKESLIDIKAVLTTVSGNKRAMLSSDLSL